MYNLSFHLLEQISPDTLGLFVVDKKKLDTHHPLFNTFDYLCSGLLIQKKREQIKNFDTHCDLILTNQFNAPFFLFYFHIPQLKNLELLSKNLQELTLWKPQNLSHARNVKLLCLESLCEMVEDSFKKSWGDYPYRFINNVEL